MENEKFFKEMIKNDRITLVKHRFYFVDSDGNKGKEFNAFISLREDSVYYLNENNEFKINTLMEFFCELGATEISDDENEVNKMVE